MALSAGGASLGLDGGQELVGGRADVKDAEQLVARLLVSAKLSVFGVDERAHRRGQRWGVGRAHRGREAMAAGEFPHVADIRDEQGQARLKRLREDNRDALVA